MKSSEYPNIRNNRCQYSLPKADRQEILYSPDPHILFVSFICLLACSSDGSTYCLDIFRKWKTAENHCSNLFGADSGVLPPLHICFFP
ncbi:hypothetical protein PENTCL1PPCAC_3130 [Pristionchus entomophagus]|uniref:C-type lectin n=1 Tax=Pristionchus entomophagus TaxID=358040 RepID=A0AAV5SJW2_9BILA|nr:hypothetical protein PENTCL1PPCAC_3130 [Pristionchus entomophagus]